MNQQARLKERFDKKWEPITESGCWVWMAAISKDGYGKIWVDESLRAGRSHRVSWEINNGKIPIGLYVLHKCDNPLCVNPDHLFLGDAKDNMSDCVSKGRKMGKKGELSHSVKLSEDDVINIIKDKRSQVEIAKDYGVSRTQICRIKKGLRWRHLNG